MDDMVVDEENAYRITERLSFPRLVGSEGEKKAIETVIDEFQNAGYETIREEFDTSFFNWLIARFIFIPLAAMLIFASYLLFASPIASIILSIIMLLVGMAATRFSGSFGNRGKIYVTENLIGTLPSEKNKADVLFMAHWDSKSQTFPIMIRIIIFMVAIFGALVLAIMIVVGAFVALSGTLQLRFYRGVLVASIVIGIIANLNVFNATGNESPGSLDNAASVAIMLELARHFKQNPPKNINLTFIATGSEELNLGGAIAFIDKHKSELDPSRTYFINLDGVGGGKGTIRLITSYGLPKKSSSDKLNDLFQEKAREKHIECKSIWLPVGAWSDYMPVIQGGFEACWLESAGSAQHVHTPKDDMDTISKLGIKNTLILNVGVVEKLDGELS